MESSRYLSIASVALVAVLSAGIGIWSGLSGPNVADAQVHQAAANLAAAEANVGRLRKLQGFNQVLAPFA